MGQLKYIDGGNPLGGARIGVDLPVGRYGYFKVVIKGQAVAEQKLPDSLQDIARIRLERRGRQLQAGDFRFYHHFADLKGGAPTYENPEAGEQRAVCYVPLALDGIPNSLDLTSKEEGDFYVEFHPALDDIFSGATYEIYGALTPAIRELYELRVREQDKQVSGSGRFEDVINGRNTAALYMYDDDDVLGQVQVQIDGDTVVDSIDIATLIDLTNLENRVENKRLPLMELNFAPAGVLEEVLNENVSISYRFDGQGTAKLMALQADFAHSDPRASQGRVSSYLAQKRGRSVAPRRRGTTIGG